ncbi:hypothetical protein SLA2020_462290 [Shorea laevis]
MMSGQSYHQSQQGASLDTFCSSGRKEVLDAIKGSLRNCLSGTNLHLTVPELKSKIRGKVRDICDGGDYLVLVTTDRQSAFDTILASIPFKGQFVVVQENTADNSKCSFVSADKNVTIVKKCCVFPVEFVGLIIECRLMTRVEFDGAREKALSLFEYGKHVALEHGLILVYTKYEFGKGSNGSILLIDEVHTPDSSGYWISNCYEKGFQNGLEPENVDKEFLRLWFKENCNLMKMIYIFLYETITKSSFELPLTEEPVHDRIS